MLLNSEWKKTWVKQTEWECRHEDSGNEIGQHHLPTAHKDNAVTLFPRISNEIVVETFPLPSVRKTKVQVRLWLCMLVCISEGDRVPFECMKSLFDINKVHFIQCCHVVVVAILYIVRCHRPIVLEWQVLLSVLMLFCDNLFAMCVLVPQKWKWCSRSCASVCNWKCFYNGSTAVVWLPPMPFWLFAKWNFHNFCSCVAMTVLLVSID